MAILKGSCLCHGVTFQIKEPLKEVVLCHCEQCQKTSGHIAATTHVFHDQLQLLSDGTLCWYQSTDQVRKGFCNGCGSSLFWAFAGRDGWSVSAGAFDDPLKVGISHHCFTTEKSDYYSIEDGLPQAPLFDLEVSRKPKKQQIEKSEE